MALRGRGKIGYINGQIPRPASTDSGYATWEELDMYYEADWGEGSEHTKFMDHLNKERLYEFLAGLNHDLDEVRGRILDRTTLPTIGEAFAEVRREEKRRLIMLGDTRELKPLTIAGHRPSENSALISRGPQSQRFKDGIDSSSNRPWYSHYNRVGHTKEKCFNFHGYPGKKQKENKAAMISTTKEDAQDVRLTKTQLEALHKLLETPTASGSLAIQGNLSLFHTYLPCHDHFRIRIADGSYSPVAGMGTVRVTENFSLDKVLYVPNLSYNLLSISKLTKDEKVLDEFSAFGCVVQEQESGKMIDTAKVDDGLYVWNKNNSQEGMALSTSKEDSIMLWHRRLGHPNFITDNGREYFNSILSPYLAEQGIIHQSSCPDTPQQNVVSERKNRQLVAVARALMFTMSVPKYLWGEAVLAACYLINQLPSKVLNFQTPLHTLQIFFPLFRVPNLPTKTFGCKAFVHNHQPNRSKLDPRAHTCVFIGYSPTQKGYKCYSPTLHRMFVSLDVTFFENEPYFSASHLQGEILSEDETLSNLLIIPQDSISPTTTTKPAENPTATVIPVLDPIFPISTVQQQETRVINHTNEEKQPTHSEKQEGKTQGLRVYSRRHQLPETETAVPMPSLPEDYPEEEVSPPSPSIYLPIAVRKGTRSCTQHPISRFVSYGNLSKSYNAFVSNVDSEISKLPTGKKTVGCKWIFTTKFKLDGSIDRYKARLVARGFTQTYGLDYEETFAPVAKLNTIRVLLSIAVNLEWPLIQLDLKNAFLNGELNEEVYMDFSPGFEESKGQVCKLKKSLYGLKQSPRAWFNRFAKAMTSKHYTQGQADHTLFYKHSDNGKCCILIVYVDDIILIGDDSIEIERLKEFLSLEFQLKNLGNLRYFLGMEIARSKAGISISQRKYVLDLLFKVGLFGCKPAETPMEPNLKLGTDKDGEKVVRGRYQREKYLEAAYRILRYLKGTPGKGLHFKKDVNRSIEVYTDADCVGAVNGRRSTSDYCNYVWGNLVTWRSKKQFVVARSSAEAEY
ncbi:hypothetical protein CXB51_000740 [Gossypium anomalum]|uniref:Integrase catalytic domain-containing protein n=1 Tax=Gossypium anomalum TaxID=47600 RepID=A0A8J6DER5_9ROSI|nr:hypothetical protein CXB51_000740 [Gossypium anomalum]